MCDKGAIPDLVLSKIEINWQKADIRVIATLKD